MEHIENETARQHSDREHAWLELLEADRINSISLSELLTMARNAKCFRVMEHLLEKQKSFDQILNCYLSDPYRHEEMWSYIQRYATQPERKIYQQINENVIQLLEIDSEKATNIIIEQFLENIAELIRLLEKNEKILYIFLQHLIQHSVSIESSDCENYLNLLCQFNPEMVEPFLRLNENYRLEKALEIIKKYELDDCLIFLYEKQGDFDAAFNLSLDLLKEAPESTAEMRALELCALCSRASNQLSDSEREKLWFSLIKAILSRSDLTQITRNILHAASAHVDLTNLVQLVLNSGTKTGNFGDIKHLLVGMLANSKYETLLLQTTARILGRDLHGLLVKEKRAASRGLAIKSIKCIVCRLRLYNQQEILIYGHCGHGVHSNCIARNDLSEKKLQCPRCGIDINEVTSVTLSNPTNSLFENGTNASNIEQSGMTLQVEAPPRTIGG